LRSIRSHTCSAIGPRRARSRAPGAAGGSAGAGRTPTRARPATPIRSRRASTAAPSSTKGLPRRAPSRLSWPGMFDQLSDRLQGVLTDVRSRGKLSEEDVNKALREVRLALLEADVNFKVVKDFTAALKGRLAGEEVSEALNPGQTVIKAVNDELTELMGG